jgi:hypothetical protein
MALPPNYGSAQLFGPFHRLASGTQDLATTKLQLVSGEIWGKIPRPGISPAVQAYSGPLDATDSGIEFWAFALPDFLWGPINRWSKGGQYVTIDSQSETAKLNVAISKVSADLLG